MKRFLTIGFVAISFWIQAEAQSKYYFPVDNVHGIEAFSVKWYSEQLEAMNEPIIYNFISGNEIYRFTWLRTFHHPVAVKIERNNNQFKLYWKMCSGAGGYSPGKLILDKQKTITVVEWNQFKARLIKIGFWNMDTELKNSLGNDGSQWILEGKNAGLYHVVDRWTPGSSTDYYKCCDYLLGLTDIKVSGQDMY